MQISSLSFKNLRSVRELTVQFDNVTALLGGNNAGKSTVLRALEIFFEAAPRIKEDDYFNRDEEDIEVTIKFYNLVPDEIKEFGSAVVNGTLTVRRIFSKSNDGNLQYEALANAYPPFAEVRALAGKSDRRSKFQELVPQTEGLSRVASADAADAAMWEWEAANPDKLQLTFLRGFFGIPNVASGKLKKKTSLHLVPAVADAQTETSDAKKSPIISLLSEISKQIYENKKEVQEFVEAANQQFAGLVDPSKVPELGGLSDLLTTAVKRYYKDSSLLADWQLTEGITVDFPSPRIKVIDQGFETSLENVGHGLQRASLFAIIQFLGERSLEPETAEHFDIPQSDIILLVEEPEIYQHPNKQTVISEAFHSICESFSRSTGIRFQIIFTTHSEKFVGMQKFQSARILRRLDGFASPSHSAKGISIAECSRHFADLLDASPMTDEAFEAKMHIFSREVCEGFFAEKVILVEGVTDRAVIEGYYKSRGINAASEGIAIIAVDGKTKLDKPLHIFSSLGIPTYPIFDSDASKTSKKQKPRTNLLIQRLLAIAQPVEFPDGVRPEFAAFKCNLEAYLKECIGESEFVDLFDEVCSELGLAHEDLCKTPLAVTNVVERSLQQGKQFPYLDQIVTAVDVLT